MIVFKPSPQGLLDKLLCYCVILPLALIVRKWTLTYKTFTFHKRWGW